MAKSPISKAPDVLNIDAELGPDPGPVAAPEAPFGYSNPKFEESDSLRHFAGRHGMTAAQLQQLNPGSVVDTRIDPEPGTKLRVPKAVTMGGYEHGLLLPFISGGMTAGMALAALRQRKLDREARARRAAGDESAESEGVNLLGYLGGGALGGAVLSVLAKKLAGPAVQGYQARSWDDVKRWVGARADAVSGMSKQQSHKEASLASQVVISAALNKLLSRPRTETDYETVSVPVKVEFEDSEAEDSLSERGREIVRKLEMKTAANPLSLLEPAMGAAFLPGSVRDTVESASYRDLPGTAIGLGHVVGAGGMVAPTLGSLARRIGTSAKWRTRDLNEDTFFGKKLRNLGQVAGRHGSRFSRAASKFGKFSGPVYWASMLAGIMRQRRQQGAYRRHNAASRYAPRYGGW